MSASTLFFPQWFFLLMVRMLVVIAFFAAWSTLYSVVCWAIARTHMWNRNGVIALIELRRARQMNKEKR